MEYLSILEIDLHFPPQVRLSDLCTLWCHGEYYDRSLLALKGKWCFDNLYISNWKVEMNNSWLFETPHWFLTEGSLIGYCAFIFYSYISSPCNVSPCCYSNQRANYILDIYIYPKDKWIEYFLCLDYHAHILVQAFGDFDKRLSLSSQFIISYGRLNFPILDIF